MMSLRAWSLILLMACAGAKAAAQVGPEHPVTVTNIVWTWTVYTKPPADSIYRFYSDGVMVVGSRSGGSAELGVEPTVTLARLQWLVRYPKAPELDPHELCVYEVQPENAMCGPFQVKPDRMLWLPVGGRPRIMRTGYGDAPLVRATDSLYHAKPRKSR